MFKPRLTPRPPGMPVDNSMRSSASSKTLLPSSNEDDSDVNDNEVERSFQILGYEDEVATGTISLGLYKRYVYPTWQPRHGWREFYQNWSDAIRESNDLGARPFEKLAEHRNGFMVFKAVHPSTTRELGYIKFSKNAGTVELVNYNSRLSGKTLGLGYTSKGDKSHLAGAHGEGYKLACLTMVRSGYLMMFKASSAEWRFKIPQHGQRNAGYLCCTVKKVKSEQIDKWKKAEVEKDSKPLKSSCSPQAPRKYRIWEDVCVKIGGGNGERVSEGEFNLWLQQSIDLIPPLDTVRTPRGDLILDPSFSNRIYLKGLLLEKNVSGRPFKYGYNFTNGTVNRERHGISNVDEQTHMVAGIWEEAIAKCPSTLADYLHMLKVDQKWAESDHAEDYISLNTATIIWKNLLDEDSVKEKFYYNETESDQTELIVKTLKKKPAYISQTLWKSLRKHELLRTPIEQCHYLLRNARDSTFAHTTYSEGVIRILKAVLALDERTNSLEICFKSGEKARLDVLIHGSRLIINDKWLDFHTSHASSYCALYADTQGSVDEIAIDIFSCDHVVEELYSLILVDLSRNAKCTVEDRLGNDSNLLHKVSEKIRQIPRKLECATGESAGQIEVSWVHPESEKDLRLHKINRRGCVVLHRQSTCADKKNDLIAVFDLASSEAELITTCGCPRKNVSLTDARVAFDNLDHEEEYFPMISAIGSQAFYAMPPPPIRPSMSSKTLDENIRGEKRSWLFPTSPNKLHDSLSNDHNDADYHSYDSNDTYSSDDESTDADVGSVTSGPILRSTGTISGGRILNKFTGCSENKDRRRSPSLEDLRYGVKQQLDGTNLDQEKHSYHNQYESTKAELEGIREKLCASVTEKRRLENHVSELESEIQQLNAKHQFAHARHEVQVSNLLNKNRKLDQCLDQSKESEARATQASKESAEKHKQVESMMRDKHQEIIAARKEIDSHRVALERVFKKLQDRDQEIESLLERSKQGSHSQQEVSAQPVEEFDAMKKEIRAKDIKIQGLLEENGILDDKLKKTKEEREMMSNTLSSVSNLVQSVLSTNPRMTTKATLQDVTNMIRGRISPLEDAKKRKRGEKNDLEDDRTAKRTQVDERDKWVYISD